MDWHARYLQQAGWTSELRSYLFQRAGIDKARCMLEVGCGTGAVLKDLNEPVSIHGLDIDQNALKECSVHAPEAILTRGDAIHLPYKEQSFDLVFCHYFLMWINQPVRAIHEMKRVTVQGGSVLAFAEPDYSKREGGPEELQKLGREQTEALSMQGADPSFGASLRKNFEECGLKVIEAGILNSSNPTDQWNSEDWMMEWKMLENDLKDRIPPTTMKKFKKIYKKAQQEGYDMFNIPTYFAWGRV